MLDIEDSKIQARQAVIPHLLFNMVCANDAFYNNVFPIIKRINLHNINYSYDGESNITQIATEHGQYDYDYDKQYRLTDIQSPVEHTGYQYDGVGNRTQATASITTQDNGETQTSSTTQTGDYNNNNQLNSYGKDSYQYDANGHTVERIDLHNNAIRKTTYDYDIEQRLIEVKAGSSTANLSPEELKAKTATELKTLAQSITPQTIASYAYNGYGQRIKKTAQGGITYYLYSQQGLAAEYDSQGNLIVEYHYKPQQTWMTYPIAQNRGGTYYYYQNDHLGTPQRLLKTSGEVVWEGRYTAFGEVTEIKNTVPNNLRFPGQYYDGETNTYYNYHRDYEPKLGRYLQSDPIGMEGGLNTYAYVNGDPIRGIDPYGLWGDSLPQGAVDFSAMSPLFILNKTMNEMEDHSLLGGGVDHFFHCLAACRAKKLGYSEVSIRLFMNAKEYIRDYPMGRVGLYGKKGSPKSHEEMKNDINGDIQVNEYGLSICSRDPQRCEDRCSLFIDKIKNAPRSQKILRKIYGVRKGT